MCITCTLVAQVSSCDLELTRRQWDRLMQLGPRPSSSIANRTLSMKVCMCRYDQYSDAWDTSITLNVLGEEVRFFHSNKSGVDRVFVDHPMFLAKVRCACEGPEPTMVTGCAGFCAQSWPVNVYTGGFFLPVDIVVTTPCRVGWHQPSVPSMLPLQLTIIWRYACLWSVAAILGQHSCSLMPAFHRVHLI